MLGIQFGFASPCEACSQAAFLQTANSAKVKEAIKVARNAQAQIDGLLAAGYAADDERVKNYEKAKQGAKKRLPGITFQATFDETEAKSGKVGRWRKNAAARLNGLFVLDIDHIDEAELQRIAEKAKPLCGSEILLLYRTASGHGMKVVAKADVEAGNIADNQARLALMLGVTIDPACKDASRLSFAPSIYDIIYISDELFEYENKEYDNRYGQGYRDSLYSAPLHPDRWVAVDNSGDAPSADNDSRAAAEDDAVGGSVDGGNQGTGDDGDIVVGDGSETKDQCFRGVEYGKIVEAYEKVVGTPKVGERHIWLLRAAKDLRYLCDMNSTRLLTVLMLSPTAQAVAKERGEKEVADICNTACGYKFFAGYPKKVKTACEMCGINLGSGTQADEEYTFDIDYDYWWQRLRPLLSEDEPYAQAVRNLPDKIKLGGILAAGAMFGTYLTRCSFAHYDGRRYRMSYIVYVIGQAASGKSFIVDLDNVLMQPMKAVDAGYREEEREYKEKKERMSTSSKDARAQAPSRPHFPIRYVPSTISNAKLYARLQDAEDANYKEEKMHLFTLESELATALRVQTGSWAGKLDLELKSFQNEYAGVDYANDLSANGLIQVNWNQVISGTMPALRKKMRMGEITDGYITRLALWIMPNRDDVMIDKADTSALDQKPEDLAIDESLRSVVINLDHIRGVLPCQRLTDFCWEWCYNQTELANLEGDKCVHYFRKRIPLYMIRYALPRIVMRQLDKFGADGRLKEGETLEITDNDLAFAELIGDYLMFISIYQWGNKLMEALEEEVSNSTPRRRQSKLVDMFERLPKTFTKQDLMAYYSNDSSINNCISRFSKANVIKKMEDGTYMKLVDSIANIKTY